jgi:ATP-binding cassette subfamily B protein
MSTDTTPEAQPTDPAATVPPELAWRGVAAEHHTDEQITDKVSGLLRDRSRRLLKDLLRPHKKWLWVVLAVVLQDNPSRLSITYLHKLGIVNPIQEIRQDNE